MRTLAAEETGGMKILQYVLSVDGYSRLNEEIDRMYSTHETILHFLDGLSSYLPGRNDEDERSTLRRHVRGVVGLQVLQFVPSDGVFWYFLLVPDGGCTPRACTKKKYQNTTRA